MRRLLRPLWFLLAIAFLIEEWLWDHLVPAIRLFVDWIPWRAFKLWLANKVEALSPPATFLVFLIPAAIYFAVELLALYPMSQGRWILGFSILAAAKVIGAAITAFTFDVTRDKLLQMDWFARTYALVLRLRDIAHEVADPYLRAIRAWFKARRNRSVRMLQRLKTRAQPAPKPREP